MIQYCTNVKIKPLDEDKLHMNSVQLSHYREDIVEIHP